MLSLIDFPAKSWQAVSISLPCSCDDDCRIDGDCWDGLTCHKYGASGGDSDNDPPDVERRLPSGGVPIAN